MCAPESLACHCTPLFTKQKAFCTTSLFGVLGSAWRQCLPGPIQNTSAQMCLILLCMFRDGMSWAIGASTASMSLCKHYAHPSDSHDLDTERDMLAVLDPVAQGDCREFGLGWESGSWSRMSNDLALHHRGYAVFHLSPVIETVRVTCNSDLLDHSAWTNYCIAPVLYI